MRTEDALHVTGKNDFEKRQKLYECIADNYVEIGSYADSVTNYELSIQVELLLHIITYSFEYLYLTEGCNLTISNLEILECKISWDL